MNAELKLAHGFEGTLQNYTIIEQLGEGGYGTVYKAIQLSTGQFVAIKTVKFNSDTNAIDRQRKIARFSRETEICAAFNHPNIVKLLDKGLLSNQIPYAVFEYVEGESLKEHLVKNGAITPENMAIIMLQVLEALSCAHAKGIVHRDLKPANIMVRKLASQWHVKVLDFGIGAFLEDAVFPGNKELTMTQDVLGTPKYSAPEQLRGEPVTAKSDCYAWGLITIECLTGNPVYNFTSIAEIFQQQLADEMIPLPTFLLGHDLGSLLRRVLAKSPLKRPANVNEIIREFNALNFSSIIRQPAGKKSQFSAEETAVTEHSNWSHSDSFRKQLTVLSLQLDLITPQDTPSDIEVIETVLKDQLNLCKDTASRFGATASKMYLKYLTVFFGYPESSDTDSRRAARAALELVSEVRNRSQVLEKRYGIRLEIRIALHTGVALIKRNRLPEGMVASEAFSALLQTTANRIFVTKTCHKLLVPYLHFKGPLKEGPDHCYELLGEKGLEAYDRLKPNAGLTAYFGREAILKRLTASWHAIADSAKSYWIQGQAGIGKSRLLFEIEKSFISPRERYVQFTCLPENSHVALAPFLYWFKLHWGIRKENEEAVNHQIIQEVLEKLTIDVTPATMAVLCSWLGVQLLAKEAPNLQSAEQQRILMYEVLRLSIFETAKSAQILAIEDAHWMDTMSKEFLNYLQSNAFPIPTLLLVSSRTERDKNILTGTWETALLNSLSEKETEIFAQELLYPHTASADVLSLIAQKSDGIPLFIEELTTALKEQRKLQLNEGKFILAKEVDFLIPLTLNDLLNAKLEGLGPIKETAQLAAGIGRAFSLKVLQTAMLKDASSVLSDLNVMEQQQLIVKQRSVKGTKYLFKHALIQEAAYQMMLPSQQKEAHCAIAEALLSMENHMHKLHVIALHFERGEQDENAHEYWYRAALDNRERSASYSDTVFFLNKSLALLPKLANKNNWVERTVEIHRLLGDSQLYTSGFTSKEVEDNCEKAFQLAFANDIDPELRYQVLNSRCFNKINRGDLRTAKQIVAKIAEISEGKVGLSSRVTALTNEAYVAYLEADFYEVLRLVKAIDGLIASKRLASYEMTIIHNWIVVKCFEFISNTALGNTALAEQQIEEVLTRTEALDFKDMIAGVHGQISSAYLLLHSFLATDTHYLERATIHVEKAIEIADQNELAFIKSFGLLMKAGIGLLDGTYTSEKEFIAKFETSGLLVFKEWYYLFVITFHYKRGEHIKAQELVHQGITAAETSGIHFSLAYYHLYNALLSEELESSEVEALSLLALEFSESRGLKTISDTIRQKYYPNIPTS